MNKSNGFKHGDISFLSEKERGQSRHTKREREREVLEICPRGNNKLVIIIFPCS